MSIIIQILVVLLLVSSITVTLIGAYKIKKISEKEGRATKKLIIPEEYKDSFFTFETVIRVHHHGNFVAYYDIVEAIFKGIAGISNYDNDAPYKCAVEHGEALFIFSSSIDAHRVYNLAKEKLGVSTTLESALSHKGAVMEIEDNAKIM